MKRFLIAAAIAATFGTMQAHAADVGISVSVGQPGFYGRLDIGDYPPPRLIYRQPMIIERVQMERAPVYLRVPPGHAKNWKKHCREYNACDERVYFVQDSWYQREYVPHYQEYHRDRRDERGSDRRDERHDDHERGNKDRGGDRHDNGRGHGRDN